MAVYSLEMGEGYDNILDELLGGILDQPEGGEHRSLVGDENISAILDRLTEDLAMGNESLDQVIEEMDNEIHTSEEDVPEETGDYTSTGRLRYNYSLSMEMDDDALEDSLSTNMDWLQDRLTPSGTSKFVFEQVSEGAKQEVRDAGHLTLNSLECEQLDMRINLLRLGVESGIPLNHLMDVANNYGWDRVNSDVRGWEHAVAQGVETTWEGTPASERRVPRRARQTTPTRANDYGLAWEIYSLGYSTGDISHLYKTSAGSISRGLKKDGRVMRTGAETKAMTKTEPDNFSVEIIDSIHQVLADKYETEEERNSAFYKAFNKNLYEVTIFEAEDEQQHIEQLHQEATSQGISINDLARQHIAEQVFVERERSEFVNNLRDLHQDLVMNVRNVFGDVNVGVGAVTVQTKLKYANGVVLTVKDAHKIDGKALDVANAVVMVNIADYIATSYERGVELLAQNFNRFVRGRFTKDGQQLSISQLGNRLVVGLDNE